MRSCPVCQSIQSHEIFKMRFAVPDDFVIGNLQSVRSCQNCGMIFSDAGKMQEAYNRYYASSIKYTADLEGPSEIETKRLEHVYQELAPYLNANTVILDFGCGGGGLLSLLARMGQKNLIGADPGPRPKIATREFDFAHLSLTEFDLREFKPDIILATGVFEHILDLQKTMDHLRSSLDPGKLLYVQVPDASKYECGVISPFQDFNLEHINHFSSTHLMQLFEANGFEIITVIESRSPHTANYLMPVISVIGKRSKQVSPIARNSNSLEGSILSYISASDRRLDQILEDLEKKLGTKSEVYLWGGGQLSLKLLGTPFFQKLRVMRIIDRSPTTRTINGIEVSEKFTDLLPDVPIIIASTLHASEIQQHILGLGLPNPLFQLFQG